MKLYLRHLPPLILLFLIGAAVGYGMAYVLTEVIPTIGPRYTIASAIFTFSIGLPAFLSALLASVDTLQWISCGEVAKDTFACWIILTIRLSMIAYGLIFALVYFLLEKRRKI